MSGDVIWTIHDRGWQSVLLRAAWGPRRVTSRRRYGDVESAYPSAVTASTGLWLRWLRRGLWDWLRWRWTVVIPATKADARIAAALDTPVKPTSEAVSDVLSREDIEALLSQRSALRAARKFAEADAIRDHLTSVGVSVMDHSIREE